MSKSRPSWTLMAEDVGRLCSEGMIPPASLWVQLTPALLQSLSEDWSAPFECKVTAPGILSIKHPDP